MRTNSSPYEVRCPRCDVSFPPKTRKCIHCGGPTGKSGRAFVEQWIATDPTDPGAMGPGATDAGLSMARSTASSPEPIEPEDAPIFTMDAVGTEAGEAESQSSLPRTLLRSFGSLIWIALLIAFTLARDCGGE